MPFTDADFAELKRHYMETDIVAVIALARPRRDAVLLPQLIEDLGQGDVRPLGNQRPQILMRHQITGRRCLP
jgi:hypothetical protein